MKANYYLADKGLLVYEKKNYLPVTVYDRHRFIF